jgi:aspartate--ammonia ligase
MRAGAFCFNPKMKGRAMLCVQESKSKKGDCGKYSPLLGLRDTERAIYLIKQLFQDELSRELNLTRVTAPIFVREGTGINDDLNGTERPVSFAVKSDGDSKAVIVHSLAKWKRMALGSYGFLPGEGIYTDMNAIRADEDLDALHSLYVDQWDWERVITKQDRNVEFLKMIVRKIYKVILNTESQLSTHYPKIKPELPSDIYFIHTEELEDLYPELSRKERENEICKKYGAVFLIGIGGDLKDGISHDGRAPDYDDWSTPTYDGFKGLNGDILVWNPVLKMAFEVSSMGIRVDKVALEEQLKIVGKEDRKKLMFHKMLLTDKLPLSIGGGLGQSRLCMFMLRKAHIGEVQVSVWPDVMVKDCLDHGILLL